jgi:hypothetical protein
VGIPSRRRARPGTGQGTGVQVEHPAAERPGRLSPGLLRLRRRRDGISAPLTTYHSCPSLRRHPGVRPAGGAGFGVLGVNADWPGVCPRTSKRCCVTAELRLRASANHSVRTRHTGPADGDHDDPLAPRSAQTVAPSLDLR